MIVRLRALILCKGGSKLAGIEIWDRNEVVAEVRAIPGLKIETWGTQLRASFPAEDLGHPPANVDRQKFLRKLSTRTPRVAAVNQWLLNSQERNLGDCVPHSGPAASS
jgi:hypothetical protein